MALPSNYEAFFGVNPYARAQYDPRYAAQLAAATEAPTGQAHYLSQAGFRPDYSVFENGRGEGDELARLMAKRQAYLSMSPEEQQLARTTGNGYFNNADEAKIRQIMSIVPNQYNQLMQENGREQLQNKVDFILNNPGFSPNYKDWAAQTQGNKTWAAISHQNPNEQYRPAEGDQLYNQLNRWGSIDPRLGNYADTLDYLQAQTAPIGGYHGFSMGYNSGFGAGDVGSTANYTGGEGDRGWGIYNSGPGPTWGNGEGYAQAAHAPTPFQNNSLLGTGGNGITSGPFSSLPSDPNARGVPAVLTDNGQGGYYDPSNFATGGYGRSGPTQNEPASSQYYYDPSTGTMRLRTGQDYSEQQRDPLAFSLLPFYAQPTGVYETASASGTVSPSLNSDPYAARGMWGGTPDVDSMAGGFMAGQMQAQAYGQPQYIQVQHAPIGGGWDQQSGYYSPFPYGGFATGYGLDQSQYNSSLFN